MPADENRNLMLLVAVAPAWLIRNVEATHERALRNSGTLWTGDDLRDAEVVLEDEDVTVTIRVKAKGKR